MHYALEDLGQVGSFYCKSTQVESLTAAYFKATWHDRWASPPGRILSFFASVTFHQLSLNFELEYYKYEEWPAFKNCYILTPSWQNSLLPPPLQTAKFALELALWQGHIHHIIKWCKLLQHTKMKPSDWESCIVKRNGSYFRVASLASLPMISCYRHRCFNSWWCKFIVMFTENAQKKRIKSINFTTHPK